MKGLLLDTHVHFWCLHDPAQLSMEVRRRIEDPASAVFVSAVSAWELEIKQALGKVRFPPDLDAQLHSRSFSELPVHLRHVAALRDLPPLHRDPFDRMLIAQSIEDDLVLVTRDEKILAYPVQSLRA